MTATLTVEVPKAPTKKDPYGVYVFHNTEDKVSLGIDYAKDGTVTGALAICSPKDQFSKKKAQLILRNRLKTKRYSTLTFPMGKYDGNFFKVDVFEPAMVAVRDQIADYLIRGEGAPWGHQNWQHESFVKHWMLFMDLEY